MVDEDVRVLGGDARGIRPCVPCAPIVFAAELRESEGVHGIGVLWICRERSTQGCGGFIVCACLEEDESVVIACRGIVGSEF